MLRLLAGWGWRRTIWCWSASGCAGRARTSSNSTSRCASARVPQRRPRILNRVCTRSARASVLLWTCWRAGEPHSLRVAVRAVGRAQELREAARVGAWTESSGTRQRGRSTVREEARGCDSRWRRLVEVSVRLVC
eukprot:981125-Rhodomonas_salina.4